MLETLNISVSSIFAGLLFSTIGIWLWRQAKIKESQELRLIAAALVLYTYFTSNPLADWGIGIGLCLLARWRWWN